MKLYQTRTSYLIISFTILFSKFLVAQDLRTPLFSNDYPAFNSATVANYETLNITAFAQNTRFDNIFATGLGRLAVNFPVKKINSGIGLHGTYDKYGFFSDTYVGLIYSYQFKLNEHIRFAVGSNFSVVRSKLQEDLDWQFSNNPGNIFYVSPEIDETQYSFNLDLGFWCSIYNVEIGLAAKHLDNVWDTSLPETFSKPLWNLILAYDADFSEILKLRNSLMVYSLERIFSEPEIWLNNTFEIDDRFILGATANFYTYNKMKAIFYPTFGYIFKERLRLYFSVNAFDIGMTEKISNTRSYYAVLSINL